MIQAIVKKGIVLGEEVPAPIVSLGCILVKVVCSCISTGTEISGVVTSGKSLIKKAMDQPEKIKKVLNWARSDGISIAMKKVAGELKGGSPTGYSLSGIVIGLGEGVNNFKIGDRVTASGGGIASHAEYVDVPVNLAVKIPDDLDYLKASTVTLGAIALHGIRRADLKLGEYCAVIGTGILGLLTIQLLKISGIRVAALDLDENRLKIASEIGAEICINPTKEDPVNLINNWANGFGVDAVIFTAATNSSEPISQSFQMCKRKGRVVLVGVSGMELKRKDIYPKELDLNISTSYGPGRYDKNYEEKGHDYPYAYVRWTENRNMAEYLRLLKTGVISLDKIISKIYPIAQVSEAFQGLKTSIDKPLFVFLDYGQPDLKKLGIYKEHDRKILINKNTISKNVINIGLVGAGNFAKNVHIPNIHKLKNKFAIHAVMDQTGYKGKSIAQQNQAKYATTNYEDILNDKNIDLVFICTNHNSHADLTLKALEAGKHVFVEKPLATNKNELDRIKKFFSESKGDKPLLMVGYNRRFSPYAKEVKQQTDKRINPLFIHYRMNAGYIPLDHWVHENGGRIVGEACHIIDLMTFFTDSQIKSISYESINPSTDHYNSSDNKSVILKYNDGSLCVIDYFAVGSKKFSKEYLEVHFDGKTIVMDNFTSLKGYGLKINEISTLKSDKGHLEELMALYDALVAKTSTWPIELNSLLQTTMASLEMV